MSISQATRHSDQWGCAGNEEKIVHIKQKSSYINQAVTNSGLNIQINATISKLFIPSPPSMLT